MLVVNLLIVAIACLGCGWICDKISTLIEISHPSIWLALQIVSIPFNLAGIVACVWLIVYILAL